MYLSSLLVASGDGEKLTDVEKAKLAAPLAKKQSIRDQVDQLNQQIQALQAAYKGVDTELAGVIEEVKKAHKCPECTLSTDLELQHPPAPTLPTKMSQPPQ